MTVYESNKKAVSLARPLDKLEESFCYSPVDIKSDVKSGEMKLNL